MTVTDIFNQDCKATVFDLPCPTSFVEDKQVIGNLAVLADPMFGGGEFSATDAADSFRFAITKEELVARSAADVMITGGVSRAINDRGGEVMIRAGDGANTHGGQGGSINMRAGDGYGQALYEGNIGDGGNVAMEAGTAYEGYGGTVRLIAGMSLAGTGGSVTVTSGMGAKTSSGSGTLLTSNAGSFGRSGDIQVQTGTSSSQRSGAVVMSTGASEKAVAGRIQIAVGKSGSGVGSPINLGAGASSPPAEAGGDAFSGGVISLVSGYSPTSSSALAAADVGPACTVRCVCGGGT